MMTTINPDVILMMTTIWSKRRFIKTIKMLFGVTILLYFIQYLIV